MTPSIPVLFAPMFDPGRARTTCELPEGSTLAQIVALAVPGGLDPALAHLRVVLVTASSAFPVPAHLWPLIRPKAGVQVVIRVVPQGDSLRSVLLAVVSIAATALAPWAAGFVGITSTFGVNAVAAGLTIAGALLVNALIPPPSRDQESAGRNTYAISGWRNELRPGAPVPDIHGLHRYAPPFAAPSWTEVVGDTQYVRALFLVGYGAVRISDLRLGQTSLDDYEGIDLEIREGRAEDAPVSLYYRQVLEEPFGVELVRPFPRDAEGNVTGGAAIETPVRRFTAEDAAEASVLIGFPSGLFHVSDGGNIQNRQVSIRIRARLDGVGAWTEVITLAPIAYKRESFLRQHTWTLPSRGRWQVELTRMTDESLGNQDSDRVVWTALQSIRPEYPVNMDKPLALVALRVKATHQLNGALENLNALVEREQLVLVAGDWVPGYGHNPASAFLTLLAGPANPFPAAPEEIDWDAVADWYTWCETKGLKFDYIFDQPQSLGEALRGICAAGRAKPRHDGVRWGVVIDRPSALVIDHISPRNSAEFSWQRSYFKPPDAFRVSFRDATNDYALSERVVPWVGHVGSIDLTEELTMPGKTDPDEIWIEARRRMYELIYRPDAFSAIQDGAARVATQGDLVMGSYDVLDRTQLAARVTSTEDNLVVIDEDFAHETGISQGIRFRTYSDETDTIGTSVVREIAAIEGASRLVRMIGTGAAPQPGEVIHLGPLSTQSMALRVRGIEPVEGLAGRLLMLAAAPEIDTLTDAEVPEAWSGRVGSIVSLGAIVPAAPAFIRIATGMSGTGRLDGLEVLLQPGAGSTAQVTGLELDHRAAGAGTWTTITLAPSAGGADITAYAWSDDVELRARAIAGGTAGSYTATVSITIGAEDPDIPAALEATSISVTGGLGHATIVIATPASATRIQVYRAPVGATLDTATHATGAPISAPASTTLTYADGDATRVNALANPGFDDASAWALDADWSIAAGKATKLAGAAPSDIAQSVPGVEGAVYRLAYDILDYAAGATLAQMIGATTATGGAGSANGRVRATLTAPASTTDFGIQGDAAFAGAIDDLVLFRQTATCVPAGAYDYYFAQLNDDDVAGPAVGPFPTPID